jgi:hypothetical protein
LSVVPDAVSDVLTVPSCRPWSVNLLDGHQVRATARTMPADLGTVLLDDGVADALETQRAQGVAGELLLSDVMPDGSGSP